MNGVKFCSVFLDHSGYAQAARNTLLAMVEYGINVKTQIVSFAHGNTDVDKGGKLALKLEKKKVDYDTKLIMLTPENFPNYVEKGKRNIGIIFWEVIGVDKRWVADMNKMDEIWTPSETYAKTFVDSGVTVPVKVISQPLIEINKEEPFAIENFDGFKFYSIFQWTERKNPKALLMNYWRTFQGKKDVCLILKTYRGGFNENENNAIRKDIKDWKEESRITDFPKTYYISYEMSENDIKRLHATGDCFVSAHRGEGWGYPQMEAMAAGKPVISTNFGGIHEYLKNDFSWPIGFKYIPVEGMTWIPWYNNTQKWADINADELSFAMWQAYNNQDLTKEKGKLAQKFVEGTFNLRKVGYEIKALL